MYGVADAVIIGVVKIVIGISPVVDDVVYLCGTVGFGLTIEAPLRNGRADAPIGVRIMVGRKVNAATYVSS
jgi:hypothetical protein